MEYTGLNLSGAHRVSNPPTRGELSRALRMAHEQLFQMWQIFHTLISDEVESRTQQQMKEMANKLKNKS